MTDKKEEGAKQEQQQPTEQQVKLMQKQAARELADYKKRLKENLDIKRMQTEELELNIKYYNLRNEWLDMQSKIEKIEEREAKLQAEQQQKAKETRSKTDTNKEPEKKIVGVKQGTPRKK